MLARARADFPGLLVTNKVYLYQFKERSPSALFVQNHAPKPALQRWLIPHCPPSVGFRVTVRGVWRLHSSSRPPRDLGCSGRIDACLPCKVFLGVPGDVMALSKASANCDSAVCAPCAYGREIERCPPLADGWYRLRWWRPSTKPWEGGGTDLCLRGCLVSFVGQTQTDALPFAVPLSGCFA